MLTGGWVSGCVGGVFPSPPGVCLRFFRAEGVQHSHFFPQNNHNARFLRTFGDFEETHRQITKLNMRINVFFLAQGFEPPAPARTVVYQKEPLRPPAPLPLLPAPPLRQSTAPPPPPRK